MSPFDESERVLSIQSHVSFGYVGGKAAVFPLQLLGYDVDVGSFLKFESEAAHLIAAYPRSSIRSTSPIMLVSFTYVFRVLPDLQWTSMAGYGRFGGSKANAADLNGLFQAMEQNGFLYPSRLLTG